MIFLFFFCTQHANNNVQRLLLANKCDAEDERRVWKDQGARVSFDFFFFSRKNVHVHVWEHFINLINLLLTVKTKPNKKPVFYYTRQNLQIYNSHPFADKVKFCRGVRCSSFTRVERVISALMGHATSEFYYLQRNNDSFDKKKFAFQLAAEKNIKFYETSAQSNINIDEVRHCS